MTFIMYTTQWCGYCKRLKRDLNDAGVFFEEVDIEVVADAAETVAKVNGGNHTVPTLLFSDGMAMTNPSVAKVLEKLGS
jgi:mycoredoxin